MILIELLAVAITTISQCTLLIRDIDVSLGAAQTEQLISETGNVPVNDVFHIIYIQQFQMRVLPIDNWVFCCYEYNWQPLTET